MLQYAYYSMFIFVVCNVIYKYKVALGYSLLIKLGMLEKTKKLIHKIIDTKLIIMIIKMKEINQCTNIAIFALSQYS